MDVVVSWSGGKDCCLAAYRAMKAGHNVRYLASVVTEHIGLIWPHLIPPVVTELQAEAIGVSLVRPVTGVAEYDDTFKAMLKALKAEGIEGCVFGDVNVGNSLAQKHKDWIDGVCNPTGIKAILPLWDEGRASLFKDFIESGFEAIITVADDSRLGKEWLGRKLNREMLIELKNMAAASSTGEVGYYHTLVVDGPIFARRLEITKADKIHMDGYWDPDIVDNIQVDGYWYQNIEECTLVEKRVATTPAREAYALTL